MFSRVSACMTLLEPVGLDSQNVIRYGSPLRYCRGSDCRGYPRAVLCLEQGL